MVTIKAVAERSGVSRVTASAVINGKNGISEKTRQKVLESCRALNFKPRYIQRANAARFSKMIGVIVRDLNNPFYSQLIHGISKVLKQHNYRMLCFDSHGELEEELGAIEAFIDHPVGGLVLTPSDHLEQISPEEHLKPLLEHGIPVVAVSGVPGQTIHVLEFDEKAVGQMATEYLIEAGHQRIYHLAGPQSYAPSTERQVAFIQAMIEHNVPFNADAIIRAKGGFNSDAEAIRGILPKPKKGEPIAIFCFNDVLAISAYKAYRLMGFRIPEDVSIIGCDDIELASAMTPSLTTIALPMVQIGQRAGELLVESIDSEDREGYVRESFAPKLVERESVRRFN